MTIIHKDGERFVQVETTAPPPHIDEFFNMMTTLEVPNPTVSCLKLDEECITPPAGISFIHEAWVGGCKVWYDHTKDDSDIEKGIDAVVSECINNHDGNLEFYLWCVWTDMLGYEAMPTTRDAFLANWARNISEYAIDVLRTDAEGAA